MKATIESTDQFATIGDVPARVWNGVTAAGVPFTAFITRVAVANDSNHAEFERELRPEPGTKMMLNNIQANELIDIRLII